MQIRNVVGHLKLEKRVDLVKFATAFREDGATYEPELFPAARIKVDGITYQLFSSGAVNLTGAKSVDELAASFIAFDFQFVKENRILD
jgi:TATA-box binding protein (TBP) (component of TFIID and TFIIIB)